LIAFINELFQGRKTVIDLNYDKNEFVGDTQEMGAIILDLTCTASTGEKFVIEVQRTSQANFKQRMLYYGSKLISDQAPKGKRKEWHYDISEVYVIVLMDGFAMPDADRSKQYLHDVCLCNRDTGEVFQENLGFFYIELVNFVKEETELQSDLDGWLYVLKHMSSMDKLPMYLRKPIFEKLFQIAEYSNLNKEEKEMYDVSLKRKWDAYSLRQTFVIEKEKAAKAERELEKFKEEAKIENAKAERELEKIKEEDKIENAKAERELEKFKEEAKIEKEKAAKELEEFKEEAKIEKEINAEKSLA